MSRRTARLAALVAAILCCCTPALAAGRAQCSAINSALMHRPVRYCALLPPTYDTDRARRYPVLYFLHGLRENEQTFVMGGGWSLLEQLQRDGTAGEFIVVTPDGDDSFFVNSADGKRPYEDFFIRELIPNIDRRFRTRTTRSERGISGLSMGGYGALHLAFAHPQLFGSVSAHMAALMVTLPREYASIPALAVAFGSPVNMAVFNADNPLTLARTRNLAGLKIYFDCGRQDDYGFDAGAIALDRILTSRHIAHDFHLYPGAHDWSYVAAHLPASLTFHWKAFTASASHIP
jgi:S-formylglutathione hydrolase FrmB